MDFMTAVPQFVIDLFKWIGSLFTTAQWHEFILATGTVAMMIAATVLFAEVTKWAWKKLPISGDDRKGAVRLMVCLVGTGTGKLLWPVSWYLPWWFAGAVLGGGGAIFVWWLWHYYFDKDNKEEL